MKYSFASTVLSSNGLASFVRYLFIFSFLMYFFSFSFQNISQPLYGGSPVRLSLFKVVSSNRSKSSSTSLNSLIDITKYFRESSTTSLWVWDNIILAKCSNIVVASFNEWQHISLPSTLGRLICCQKWVFFLYSCVVFSFKKWNKQIWTILLLLFSLPS